MTATGANRQNSGVSSTRPCMKSPPWRIQYSACRAPLTSMNATTAGGFCTVRASQPEPGGALRLTHDGRPRNSITMTASPISSTAGAHSR